MCGLFGMVGKGITEKDRNFLKALAKMSILRGEHSTGLFVASPDQHKDKRRIKKMVVNSYDFIKSDDNSRDPMIDKNYSSTLFMGHTRWATVGAVDFDSAHPFDVGNFVGAHNGTLIEPWSFHKHKSDSLLMFEEMQRDGIKPVLDKMAYDSAWALSIYSKQRKTLTLARNDHRDLSIAFNEDRSVMYWASESGMLEYLGSRYNLNLDIYELIPYVLYEVFINRITKDDRSPWDALDIVKPEKPSIMVVRGKEGPEKKEPPKISQTSLDTILSADDGPWVQWNNDNMADNWLWEECCCICDRLLEPEEVKTLVPVEVDGTNYYCCDDCKTETIEQGKKELLAEQKSKSNNLTA